MKLSHKVILVSAAALMAVSPLVEAGQNPVVVQAKRHKKAKKHVKKSRASKKASKSLKGKIVLGHNSYIYFASGKRNKKYKSPHAKIVKGVVLNYSGTKTINGQLYFCIGGNNYIKAANVKTKDGKKYTAPVAVPEKITPQVKLNHNSYEYSAEGKAQYKKGKHIRIKKGKTISVKGLHYIDDVLFYDLGNGHFIKAQNADQVSGKTLKPDNKKKSSKKPAAEKKPFSIILKSTSGVLTNDGTSYNGSVQNGISYAITTAKYFGQNLYYQLPNANAWVPASDVATKSGDEPTAVNAPYTPASAILKSTLKTEISSWDTANVKNSLSYKLAGQSEREAFDKALANAKSLMNNPYAALNEVNDAAKILDAAHSNLNGSKVQVADLSNLTADEQTAILNAVASANGISAADLKFANNNQSIVYTNANGYATNYAISDYAEKR